MAGRVGVHQQWSEFGWKSSRWRQQQLRGFRLPRGLDEEVEVHLHGYVGTGPYRWAEIVDLLESMEPFGPETVTQCSFPFVTPPVSSA